MIRKIENGDGISMVLVVNNKKMRFDLTLMQRKIWGDELVFGFTSEEGYYFQTPYSGGNTGFGNNDVRKMDAAFHEEYRVLTKDLDAINQAAEYDAAYYENEQKRRVEKKKEKAARINKLPKEFQSSIASCKFVRGDAFFDPTRSSKIQGLGVGLKTNEGTRIFLSDYVTRDGKKQTKKFAKEVWAMLGTEMGPEEALETLLKERKEVVEKIKNA